ncbi:hypothetical protein [Halomarina oriensis]|uniref:Uncharacterized protein n=1 Tax=Halomarina oriensis TaxID=671145 RepID=A0A6B0GQ27_9EURY|nr:hypothetical protein [Halomarina oriensis]MWG35487.1 hypothetical protein [Halomarina oriensis]
MDDDLLYATHLVLLQLVVLDAVVHLDSIWANVVAVAASGVFPRLATALMVLSILGTGAGIVAFRVDLVSRRTLYLLGVGFMLAQLLGWFVYHNVAAPNFGHSHGTGFTAVVNSTWEHLTQDPLEGVSKLTETLALVVLLVLLRVDPRARPADDGPPVRERLDA